MKNEEIPFKIGLKQDLFKGLFFASFMANFDYFNDVSFSIYKFLFYGFFFGLSITLINAFTKNQSFTIH